MEKCGALNTISFSENYKYNRSYPQLDSITYDGIINSNYFQIEDSNSTDLLSLELDSVEWYNPYFNMNEVIVSMIMKTKYDGIGARKPIDLVFVLDKSGSMSSSLGKSQKSCISLAKEAILKLIEFLNEDDKISLVAIDTRSTTVFPLTFIKNFKIDKELYDKTINDINLIIASGGTELCAGYEGALSQFGCSYNKESNQIENISTVTENTLREKRIIYSTDMNYINDNNFGNMIKKSSEKNIFTTIIGIGVNLNSNFTELVCKNKGCNYFSAMETEDLENIMIGKFDYHFFPVAHNIVIKFQNSDYKLIDSIGTDINLEIVKNEEEENYWRLVNHIYEQRSLRTQVEILLFAFKKRNLILRKPILAKICNFLKKREIEVTRLHSFFPCSTKIESDNKTTVSGGLMLLRLVRENEEVDKNQPKAQVKNLAKITLNYHDLNNDFHSKDYKIDLNKNKDAVTFKEIESTLELPSKSSISDKDEIGNNSLQSNENKIEKSLIRHLSAIFDKNCLSSTLVKALCLYSYTTYCRHAISKKFISNEDKNKLFAFTKDLIAKYFDNLKENDYLKELNQLEELLAN